MAEPNMIYKITALELLSKAEEPLSNSQITDFFLDCQYTDYFNVQQILNELKNSGLITSQTLHNNTRYQLTREGASTLSLFYDKITASIAQDIKKYLREHDIEIRSENALSAHYDKSISGGYLVHCSMREGTREILVLTLHVATQNQAETICNNWKVRSEDVYMTLMDTLIQ